MRWGVLLLAALMVIGSWAQNEKIQPNDTLKVTVRDEESLSRAYKVDAQGNIQFPLIGLVKVAGLTVNEAAQTIARLLRDGQFLRDPRVTVERTAAAEPTVSVSGAVGKAGNFKLKENWRLSDALEQAQPTTQADLSAVRLERTGESVQTINHQRFIRENDGTMNPLLEPNDRIFVPLKAGGQNVIVLGAVKTPGVVEYETGLTVAAAITKAGGATTEADLSMVKLERKGTGQTQTLDLTHLSGDTVIGPGDEITVPIKANRQFFVVRGAVRNPGLFNYTEGMALTQAIDTAGGPNSEARLDKVVIERPTPRRLEKITVNMLQVAQGARQDERVLPGDTVVVPGAPKQTSLGEILNIIWLLLSIALLLSRR